MKGLSIITALGVMIMAAPFAVCQDSAPSTAPAALKVVLDIPELMPGPYPRTLINQGPGRCFHVVIENVSSQPVFIWDESNSEGAGTLSFEITEADGTVIKIERVVPAYAKNIMRTDRLDPEEVQVREIYYNTEEADRKGGGYFPASWYPEFPFGNRDKTVTIRAVFEQKPVPEPNTWNLWTGRIVSKPYTVILSGD